MKIASFNALSTFLAQTGAPTQGGSGNGMLVQLGFFGLMFAAMYFLLIAPQRRKQKEHEKMLAALATGDEVVTSGGIYGVITNVREDRFILKISENTKIEVGRGFVQGIVAKTGEGKK
ncbi:MAG: preprotein translocase subunit YajC [Opitutaceae bacterium]